MSDRTARIARLQLFPVKGCAGFDVSAARLAATGLELDGVGDREWVVVDREGEFLSQRELPAMALIRTRLTPQALELRAPGMLPLIVPLESEGEVEPVRVWNDTVAAVSQGKVADTWFSDYLGMPARLMRFDPEARRLANPRYAGATPAPYKFADAFALLVANQASLAELNARLRERGAAAVGIERFRANVVLDGLDAFEEDYAARFVCGDAVLRAVKPCVRCTVPNVDPDSGEVGTEPGATLATFRNDPQAGGLTFGVNAIVERPGALAVGDDVGVSLRF